MSVLVYFSVTLHAQEERDTTKKTKRRLSKSKKGQNLSTAIIPITKQKLQAAHSYAQPTLHSFLFVTIFIFFCTRNIFSFAVKELFKYIFTSLHSSKLHI